MGLNNDKTFKVFCINLVSVYQMAPSQTEVADI